MPFLPQATMASRTIGDCLKEVLQNDQSSSKPSSNECGVEGFVLRRFLTQKNGKLFMLFLRKNNTSCAARNTVETQVHSTIGFC